MSANPWVWVAGLTIIAFFMRRYHLGTESLWFDEADIVAQARQPLPTLLESFAKAGENGPLYTLMLHFWLALGDTVPGATRVMHLLFGTSYEAPIRGLSMLFGTAGIPAMYALAKRVGGVGLGIASAALLTVNPFHLWYSQDAKMYTLLVLMTLVTTLLYINALERNTVLLWAGYVLATWIMLTSHSLSGLVLLSQIVATPFLLRRRTKDEGRKATTLRDQGSRGRDNPNPKSKIGAFRWAWAMLLILAPLFPIVWLRLAALVTGTVDTGHWYASTSLPDILFTIFVKFAVNQAAPWNITDDFSISWEVIGALVMAALAIVGAWQLAKRRTEDEGLRTKDEGLRTKDEGLRTKDEGLRTKDESNTKYEIRNTQYVLFALWLVPITVFWLVTLALPLFHPRYLIMALPPYLIMAAAGILALRRVNGWLMAVPVALLAASTGAALLGVNYSPTIQKEDWRGAMVYVQDHLRLRDTIVVFPGYLSSAVKLYYKPDGPGLVPDRPVQTIRSLNTDNYGERERQADLANIVTCSERAWLIVSPIREDQEDPQHAVRQWFQYNYHTFDTKEFNGVTVFGVSFNGQPNCWYPKPVVIEAHTFENGLSLLGYTYELRDDESDHPTQPDASYLPLTLYWHSPGARLPDYDILIRVIDPSGKVVKEEARGPLNGYWPTSQWPPDYDVIDYRDLRLPGNLTPGKYKVSVQVYPKGQPDKPLKLENGATEMVLGQSVPVVPWKP